MEAPIPSNQSARLVALREYDILDTPPEVEFDDITRLVAAICETPVALISFVEEGRQWFKGKLGVEISETALDQSICAHALLEFDYLEVPDTTKDKRTLDNPLVAGDPHLRFYAGATLQTSDGFPLGTVCTLDFKPRQLNEFQREALKMLARQVMKLLELRRSYRLEREARKQADLFARENETLLREGDHRVMNSLQLVTAVLSLQARDTKDENARALLDEARNRVGAIAAVHRQLQSSGSLASISISPFLERLCESMQEIAPPSVTAIEVKSDEGEIPSATASTLGLIAAELIANSFKHAYSAGSAGKIYVEFDSLSPGWKLAVCDDGAGLPKDFDISTGRGIGMKVVTSLARRLEAELSVSSKNGRTVFALTSNIALSKPAKEAL